MTDPIKFLFATDFKNKSIDTEVESDIETIKSNGVDSCYDCDKPMLDHDDPLYKTDNDVIRCDKCYNKMLFPITLRLTKVKIYLSHIFESIMMDIDTKYVNVDASNFITLSNMLDEFEKSLNRYSLKDNLEIIDNIKAFRSKNIQTSREIMEDKNYKYIWRTLQQIRIYILTINSN